jgi:pyruvate formate lyase activating enzyme
MSVDEIMEIVLKDLAYYRHSGGGVTFSGGECTMHSAFLELLLARLKEGHLNVMLETSGYFDYAEFSKSVLPYVDYIYYDIKIMDPDLHLASTGCSNKLILENFKRLLRQSPEKVFPRVPLVPGITDTGENLKAIVDFLYGSGARNPILLPYNPAGMEMHEKLGRARPVASGPFMGTEAGKKIREFVNEYARSCRQLA